MDQETVAKAAMAAFLAAYKPGVIGPEWSQIPQYEQAGWLAVAAMLIDLAGQQQ